MVIHPARNQTAARRRPRAGPWSSPDFTRACAKASLHTAKSIVPLSGAARRHVPLTLKPPRSENTANDAAEPAFVCLPRRAFAGNQRIGVAVPLAPGIIIAENRGICLGLTGQTERQVDFDEPFERFGD